MPFFNLAVDDESTIGREKFCKFAERIADIINVFKEIEMIFFNIQYNSCLREEMEETVCVFACFSDKYIRVAHTDVSANGMEDAAYRHSRIRMCVSMEVVVVFPWVPDTAMGSL